MSAEVRELARRLAILEKGVRSLSTAPRLLNSSIENGRVPEYDADGNLVAVLGRQTDGTHGVVNLTGPLPPAPAGMLAEGGPGRAVITWDGTFVDAVAPLDLLGIEVFVAEDDFTGIENAQFLGRMSGAEAGTVNFPLLAGTYHVALVALSNSYRRSVVSPRAEIEITAKTVGLSVTTDDLIVNSGLIYRGEPIEDALGGKIVARGRRDTGGSAVTIPIGGSRDFLQVSFDAEPGHSYRVSASGPVVRILFPGTYSANNLQDAYGSARLKIGIDAIPGPTSDYDLRSLHFIGPGYSTAESSLVISREPTDAPAVITAVYSIGGSAGYGVTTLAAYDDIEMIVEDIGITVSNTGIELDGTAAPPEVVKSYTYTDALEWHQNYTGAGGYYTYNDARHYQGYYLSMNGILKSMLGFPDIMRTRLAGSAVDKIEVYLHALWWNNSTGGRARVGTHNMDTKPSTFSGNNFAEWSFARGEPAWITLPSSWYQYYESGLFKGITLGYGATTDPKYYGYFDAAATRVRYTYRK